MLVHMKFEITKNSEKVIKLEDNIYVLTCMFLVTHNGWMSICNEKHKLKD